MANSSDLGKAAAKGAGPPKGVQVGPLFQRIITRGRLPFEIVDFPRYDAEGKAVVQVYVRTLSQAEQDLCRANAAKYVADALSGARTDVKWKPEEMEDNAICSEILAISCRDPEEPEKPFFPYGVTETRECSPDELAILFAVYGQVREKAYPTFRDMDESEMWKWVRALEEGAQQFPFSYVSRAKLEAFCAWVAKSYASDLRQLGATSSASPSEPSSE